MKVTRIDVRNCFTRSLTVEGIKIAEIAGTQGDVFASGIDAVYLGMSRRRSRYVFMGCSRYFKADLLLLRASPKGATLPD